MPDLLELLVLGLAVIATAVLSSLITLALAKRQVSKTLAPRIERRVRGELDDALEDLGNVVEDRVKRGVLDAISSLPAGDLLRTGPSTVVRTATGLVEGGLSSLLGGGRRPDGDSDDER